MKKMILILAIFGIFGAFLGSSSLYARPEGKVNKEIDLPIERPKVRQPKEDKKDEPNEDNPEFYGEVLGSETDTIVFVVDYSCSMNGSRISKAKSEVVKAINSLSKNFKFSIVTYTCYIKTWQPKLVPANAANKGAASAWINGQNPSGATGTGLAVKAGLKLDTKNKLVVLLTDGAPNCIGSSWKSASEHLSMIVGANGQKAKIDVFAIQPWGGSYKTFCQNIAQKSGGKYKEVN